MSEADAILVEKHLKKITIRASWSILSAIVIALSSVAGFYFTTSATLHEHTTDINEVKETVQDVQVHLNEMDVFKGVSLVEMKAMENGLEAVEKQVEKVDKKVDKLDDKLDRILYQTRN